MSDKKKQKSNIIEANFKRLNLNSNEIKIIKIGKCKIYLAQTSKLKQNESKLS